MRARSDRVGRLAEVEDLRSVRQTMGLPNARFRSIDEPSPVWRPLKVRVRIFDVDGIRVVVQTYEYPGTSTRHRAELQAIVDSIEVTP